MYTAIKGIYENGRIIFTEPAPTTEKSEVIVTFLDTKGGAAVSGAVKPREGGWLKKLAEEEGIILPPLPDDFNEPLDDLADYM